MGTYCDECQRTKVECDHDVDTYCFGSVRREYFKRLAEYEDSSDWISDGTELSS